MDSSETVQSQLEVLPSSVLSARLLLKRVRNLTRILYTSAIVHSLTPPAQIPPAVLAEQLAEELIRRLQQAVFAFDLPIPSEAQSSLKIQVIPNGLIQVELSDRSIALWLAALFSATPHLAHPISPRAVDAKVVFAAQHSHARCCSLLRLAPRQRLLRQRPTQAAAIAWLDSTAALPLSPAARCLVCQLFTGWEALFQPRSVSPDKLLFSLTQSFQTFHSTTQLFDRSEQIQREVNCGLLLATQQVLYWWLTLLQFLAPVDL